MSATGTRALRKILIVNTADEGGGAERVSMDALDGLAALGVDTWLIVGDKKTNHARVMPFWLSPFMRYDRYEPAWRQAALAVRRRTAGLLGIESFAYPYSHRLMELAGSPPDLVLCHNLHGGYFDLRALAPLSRRVPVVLRLFDSWLMTGHCAYPNGCARWRDSCGRCPDLAAPPAVRRDATRLNWRRKQRTLGAARVFISAESQWMLDRARQSLLAEAACGWKLLPSGVDLDIFAPGPRDEARRALGLDPHGLVVAFVANGGTESRLKDFATVRQALAVLAQRVPRRALTVLVVGADGPAEEIAPGITLCRLGYLRAPARVAAVYRAADIYVHAAREETYGLSVAEALAGGAAVVTASQGGVREIVAHERTALAVPPGAPAALADAIARLLDAPALRAALGAAAAASARAGLDRRASIGALHAWLSDVHAAWRPAP